MSHLNPIQNDDPDGLLPLSKGELKEVCISLRNRFEEATDRLASLTKIVHVLHANLEGLVSAYERKDFESLHAALDVLLVQRTGNLAIMKAKHAAQLSSVRR